MYVVKGGSFGQEGPSIKFLWGSRMCVTESICKMDGNSSRRQICKQWKRCLFSDLDFQHVGLHADFSVQRSFVSGSGVFLVVALHEDMGACAPQHLPHERKSL